MCCKKVCLYETGPWRLSVHLSIKTEETEKQLCSKVAKSVLEFRDFQSLCYLHLFRIWLNFLLQNCSYSTCCWKVKLRLVWSSAAGPHLLQFYLYSPKSQRKSPQDIFYCSVKPYNSETSPYEQTLGNLWQSQAQERGSHLSQPVGGNGGKTGQVFKIRLGLVGLVCKEKSWIQDLTSAWRFNMLSIVLHTLV